MLHSVLPTFTYTWAKRNQQDHQYTDHKSGIHPTLHYQSDMWTLTSKESQILTTTEMTCLRKAAGKTRMDKIRNEEIRRRVNMQPAEQTSHKNKIRWWSHVKSLAPTAPRSKALVIQPVGKRLRGRPRNRWEDDARNKKNTCTISALAQQDWGDYDLVTFKQLIKSLEDNKGIKTIKRKQCLGRSNIISLKEENGTHIHDRGMMIKRCEEFYTNLYSTKLPQG